MKADPHPLLFYIGRRALRGFTLLLGVSFLCFALLKLAPGDYFTALRLDPHVPGAAVDGLRGRLAPDQPFAVRYFDWLGSVFRGDFGYSLAYNVPAGPLLWARAGNTLLLTSAATLAAWMIALPLGIWNAATSSKWVRLTIQVCISTLIVLPDLLLVLLLMLIAANAYPGANRHFLLPAAALMLSMLPPIVAHTRSSMTETLDSTFIRAARAHGIGPGRLLFRHALPASANSLISLFGASLGALLSSSFVVEAATGWPGLGQMVLQATFERDVYVVIAGVMYAAVFLVVGNLVADVLQHTVDPRIVTGAHGAEAGA